MATAVEARALGKRYRLGTDRAGYDTLRDAILRTLRSPRGREGEIWALREINFSLATGEAVGIVGRNGAGKTTLLKILSRVTDPTCGEARTRGQVGALLEVGTGLHPELTGRENVFLMGGILGMRRAEVRRRFDDIATFSGVKDFLDTPVKRYSAGMRLRLAFSVAAHIQPPIVVIDEVLAMGDAVFREACMRKLSELGGGGRTVLFVSHDLGAVTRLCSRILWIDSGHLRLDGPADEVIPAYLEANLDRPLTRHLDAAAGPVSIVEVLITDGAGRILTSPRRDQPFTIELRFDVSDRVPGLDLSLWIRDETGAIVLDDAQSDRFDHQPPELPGRYRVRVTVPGLLAPRRYTVGAWVGTGYENFFEGELLDMRIAPRPDDSQASLERRRMIQPPLQWTIERTPVAHAGFEL